MVLCFFGYDVGLDTNYPPFTIVAPKVAIPPQTKLRISPFPTISELVISACSVGIKINSIYTIHTSKGKTNKTIPTFFINPLGNIGI